MTKLIGLRVTLAVDDAVDIKDVKPRMAALIAAGGTEHIGEDGSGARVHWTTCEVLQGPERMPPQRRSGKRQPGQADLLPGSA